MESGLLRAQKAAGNRVNARSSAIIDCRTHIYCRCCGSRVDHEAKRAIAAVHEGDMLMTQLAVLRRFGKRSAVDTISLRRRVATAVQAQDRYPFEGR